MLKRLAKLVTHRVLTANTSLQLAGGSYMAAGVGVVRQFVFSAKIVPKCCFPYLLVLWPVPVLTAELSSSVVKAALSTQHTDS